mgnify:CR=1 FL=1
MEDDGEEEIEDDLNKQSMVHWINTDGRRNRGNEYRNCNYDALVAYGWQMRRRKWRL